jgi:hypothetical protein
MTQARAPDPTSRRDMVVRELGRQMSRISEEAACSLWTSHMDDELPAVLYAATLTGSPGHYRGEEISPVYAAWYTPRPDSSGHGGGGPADSPSDAKSGS